MANIGYKTSHQPPASIVRILSWKVSSQRFRYFMGGSDRASNRSKSEAEASKTVTLSRSLTSVDRRLARHEKSKRVGCDFQIGANGKAKLGQLRLRESAKSVPRESRVHQRVRRASERGRREVGRKASTHKASLLKLGAFGGSN